MLKLEDSTFFLKRLFLTFFDIVEMENKLLTDETNEIEDYEMKSWGIG